MSNLSSTAIAVASEIRFSVTARRKTPESSGTRITLAKISVILDN
jgi:hypothetical protein